MLKYGICKLNIFGTKTVQLLMSVLTVLLQKSIASNEDVCGNNDKISIHCETFHFIGIFGTFFKDV